MGVLTLADYRADLDSGLQRTVSNTLKDRWVNQALKEFGYAFRFHELEQVGTLVIGPAGTIFKAGPVGMRYIEELVLSDPAEFRARLIPETRSEYLRNVGDALDSTTWGVPRYYNKFGSVNIYLRPVPDLSTYQLSITYGLSITNLAAAGDVSPFHEDWDEAISLGALYRGFRQYGEFDRYQNIRADFLGFVRSRKTEYELEEFPEGGIQPVGPGDTEDVLIS